MNQKETKPGSDLRPLWLTAVLSALSVLAALDITYGTRILGHLALPCAVGLLCVIFMTCEKHIFVLDAAAMLVILFLTSNGELSLSLLGAVLIVASLILAALVRKRCAKISAVLAVCVTIAVGYVTVWTIFYAADGNSLAPAELLSKLNAYFDSFKPPLADQVREAVEGLSESTLAYYAKREITKEMLLEMGLTSMEAYVDMVQMLMPGCLLFLVQIVGYIGVISFERTVKLSRYDALLPEVHWSLYPSHFSCIVYFVVTTFYIITMFFASSIFTIIVTNIWITLSPVMIACGVRGLIMRLKHPRFRRSTIVILVLFVLAIFFLREAALSFALMMLAYTGAQDVSAARAAEAMKMHFEDKNKP